MKTSMFGTKSQGRLHARGDALSTSMRRNCGGPIKTSVALLLFLLTLSLVPSQSNAEPVRVRQTLEILMYVDRIELHEACVKSGTPLPEDYIAAGCRIPKPWGQELHVPAPGSWCDWVLIKTWGHELMHAAGYKHHKDHEFNGGRNDWEAKHCEFVYE